jgi:hypothetical protein
MGRHVRKGDEPRREIHPLTREEAHTFLTTIETQLGNSSIQVTVDIYGHLMPGSNRAAVDRLDARPICIPGASGAAPHSRLITNHHKMRPRASADVPPLEFLRFSVRRQTQRPPASVAVAVSLAVNLGPPGERGERASGRGPVTGRHNMPRPTATFDSRKDW